LVPAAVIGVDVKRLLDEAEGMKERCGSAVPAAENDGCRFGAYLGALAGQGRDKLTIISSPSLESFGLWAEQLVAESTGKNGKGIVPIVGEPLAEVDRYGADRTFVYMRLDGDENSVTDSFVEALKEAGQPTAVIEMKDKYGLGAAFYLWEYAVAVAGISMGIHPFDQPDVQRAKDATVRVLKQYEDSGRLPPPKVAGSLDELISQAREGDYLAVMAYVQQTGRTDEEFNRLRTRVLEERRLPSTLGYGPRFLHSTGQIHKGGPDNGLFVQVVSDHDADLAVPGRSYTFETMADAQSLGDLEALVALGRRVIRIGIDQLNKRA
jgi:glucose-6-phosphate isomerase/transaldolase/glucose-6-phosphate isomerase